MNYTEKYNNLIKDAKKSLKRYCSYYQIDNTKILKENRFKYKNKYSIELISKNGMFIDKKGYYFDNDIICDYEYLQIIDSMLKWQP